MTHHRRFLPLFLAVFAVCGWPESGYAEDELSRFMRAVPGTLQDFAAENSDELEKAAEQLEVWANDQVFGNEVESVEQLLRTVEQLLQAKSKVDASLEQTLALRKDFARLPVGRAKRLSLRQFLQVSTTLIDLSGRLRYVLRDAVDGAAYYVARDRAKRMALIEMLVKYRSGIGAGVMSVLLEDPPSNSGVKPPDDEVREQVLQLIAETAETDLLPKVVHLVRNPRTSPQLLLTAAETIRKVGLPQDPHPDQDKSLPPPDITAGELHEKLAALDASKLTPELSDRRQRLLSWLDVRMTKGITGEGFQFAGHEVRPGDWLLMRNPSPYNLFTDLSPGLFTHVGVVTTDEGPDGIRRFVLVDLPERGEKIPVTNVDTYILRTLHYCFVRHPRARVAASMAQAAREMIGNPTEFDLTFRTARIDAYRGKSLKGQKINTYCAGFLLICAQQSDAPRDEFFPVSELAAPGKTVENLKSLGLSVGKDFISPTGAMFSSRLAIVGTRRPMYDPTREVKEAIYDHFASQMRDATLHQSPNAQQALRQRLAEMSKENRWLRLALAKASGVSQHMDLVSAARAAAVVETLDDVADESMNDFWEAQQAFYAGPLDPTSGVPAEQIAKWKACRKQHDALYQAWSDERLTPLELRNALIQYYAGRGRRDLDARFFTAP